ncbi:hypothetical protein KIW84_071268 [Lathyrus oleraceus]|uniref:Uncharacterized protein n=1 Tax=Pisum sativum TaxID=3888 RepID=A0A9D4VIC3_PEA|nr:hypothetical protein KIW84_071268 [Pisum sativum]
MKGANNLGGLRFQEQFGKINVHILIELCSSYNFTTKNSSIPEVVNRISTRVMNWAVPVYLLPVAGSYLILGMSRLAKLGPHVADYATLILENSFDDTRMQLHH